MEGLTVKDIMSKDVVTAGTDEPVLGLIARLIKFDIGAIVILNTDQTPFGIVTRRDILECILLDPADYRDFTAIDIARVFLVTVEPGLDALTAYTVMKQNRVNRLPVVSNGRLSGIITHRDITNVLKERVETLEVSHENIRKKMQNDFLTGVYNRGYMEEELEYFMEAAKRTGVAFSLLAIDIDNFKNINDAYGHMCGDMILKGAARIFVERSKNVSIVGRFGGDEFMIIVPYSDYNTSAYTAERLRMSLEEHVFVYEGREIRVTASIGLVEWTRDMKNAQELLRLADNCLYEAKNSGKNRVGVYGITVINAAP